MNDFDVCYKIAEDGKCEPFWNDVYKKAFPNMTNHMRGKQEKCNSQDKGVDRIIFLENSKTITLDEKVRVKSWNDIALEYISNDKKNTPGWMEKELGIDYLAYAFLDTKTAYLFDWRMLKRAWNHYKEVWKKEYKTIKAPNKYYTTFCVPVPIDELMRVCSLATVIRLDDNNNSNALHPKLNLYLGKQISLF